MSDEIPLHIQEEIMKRLPVKSLVQFICVSKAWKSLINSSEFISSHSLRRHTQQQHLLVSYKSPMNTEDYVCFVDDDTFPQQRSFSTLPPSVKVLTRTVVVGSSHGLLCLHGYGRSLTNKMVVIWNPSIRKSIAVSVPKESYIGFGVCPVTSDPKIVVITKSQVLNFGVMVYTLGSGKWKSLSNNLSTKRIHATCWSPVVTDRFIYWHCFTGDNMILSFDVSNESFEALDLPDSLAHHYPMKLCISKLRESLAILQEKENMCTVWMMEHVVRKSFTKLFTINTLQVHIMGFRKSDVALIKVTSDVEDDERFKLVAYKPNSKQNYVIESSGIDSYFYVNSYMETLLLLGRSDCTSY